MSAPNTKQIKLDGKNVCFLRLVVVTSLVIFQKLKCKKHSKLSVMFKTKSIGSMNKPVKRFFKLNRNTINFDNRIIKNVCLFFCKERQISELFFEGSDLISKIPSFWISVFLNHPQLSGHLDQNDENILQYLKRVDVEEVNFLFQFRIEFLA